MKRWMYILTMLLVGIAIIGLLMWVAAHHNVRSYAPTTADRIISAAIFWITLVMPAAIALFLAIRAVDVRLKPLWPVIELPVVGFLLLVIFGSNAAASLYSKLEISELVAHIIVVVAIGTATLNLRLGIRDRKWTQAALSALTAAGGTVVLLVFNGWAVYWE